MGSRYEKPANAAEIDRLALIVAKEPGSKAFLSLAEEYGKAGMWEEAAAVLEDGLKTYPNFITAMVALGKFSGGGHLPGDIVIQTENFSCWFPIVSSIVLSIVLTILLNLILRWLNR